MRLLITTDVEYEREGYRVLESFSLDDDNAHGFLVSVLDYWRSLCTEAPMEHTADESRLESLRQSLLRKTVRL